MLAGKFFITLSRDVSENASRLPATGRKVRPVTPSISKGPTSGLPKKEGPLWPPWTWKIFVALSRDTRESAAHLPPTDRKVRPVTPSVSKGPASALPKKEGPLWPPLDLENFRRAFSRRVGKRGALTRDRTKSSSGHAVRFQGAGIQTSKKGRSSSAPPWTWKIFVALSRDASENAARQPATGRKVRPVTPSFSRGPASGLPKKEGPLWAPLDL